jgi:hypothetical protein
LFVVLVWTVSSVPIKQGFPTLQKCKQQDLSVGNVTLHMRQPMLVNTSTWMACPGAGNTKVMIKCEDIGNRLEAVVTPGATCYPEPPKKGGPPGKDLLIGVETAPSHGKARAAILESWAAFINPRHARYNANLASKMDIKFFIGELGPNNVEHSASIAAEPNIVRLEGFIESYGNLSAKTLGIIKWAHDNNYKHLLKVDDDVFLQLDYLSYWMDDFKIELGVTYAGEFVAEGAVVSNPKSKWYMADQYPHPTFPPYAFGSTYFLGHDLVEYLGSRSKSLPLFRVEDAGVALWLQGFQPGVKQEQLENMYFQADCWNSYAIFTTPVNAGEMSILQQNKDRGSLCGPDSNTTVLEECVVRRCRCYPIPEEQPCDQALADEEYRDLIPRL